MAIDWAKLAKAVEKEIGTNTETSDVRGWVSTGFPPLNKAISGSFDKGLPCGRIIEIFGPSSAGKTALATQAMISAQKQGGVAGFADHERSFKLGLAKKLGLTDAPGQWFFRQPKTFESSVAEMIRAARSLRNGGLPREAPIVWVFDSLAAMVPGQILLKMEEGEAQKMNDKLALASLTSQWFPGLANFAEEYNICIIFLNQIRLDPGVTYGNPEKTPGGKAPAFYASVRIQLGAQRIMKEVKGDEKIMIGSEITARCVKNKVNRPYLTAKWKFSFNEDGTGYFDSVGSLIDFALKKDLIEKSGTWITWGDGTKHQGTDKLAKYIESNALQDDLIKLITSSEVELEEDKSGIEDEEDTGV